MSRLYESYRTDKAAEAAGVWYPDSGANFLLARMGGANLKYQRAMTAAMKPHMRELQLGLIDEKTLEDITREVFIDTVLLNWTGVEGDDDLPMTFSKENAVKLFADLPDLYARLREQAQSFANYRAAALKDAAKN